MSMRKRRILPVILITVMVLAAAFGGWSWYDNNVDRSGWVEKNGIRFYRDFHADPVSGWLELSDGRYYFHSDGTPHLGWQEIDGITYYFDDTGAMHTRWLEKNGETYYFGGNGAMVENGVSGVVVPRADAEALATALSSLEGDRKRLARMNEAALLRYNERFTPQRMTRELEVFYLEQINNVDGKRKSTVKKVDA